MFNFSHMASFMGAVLLLGAPFCLSSCKENIDDSAYAIKTEKTMMDYISDDPNLSEIKSLFEQVKLGKSANASTLESVLSARGNYTVFAPNNDAVHAYVQSLTGSTDINSLTAEQKQRIALNCIIDNGSNSAYETADFPVGGNTFSTSNLSDRRLACTQDSVDQSYVINGDAKCVQTNIEVSNGYLHVVDHVISPSTNSVAELVQAAPNLHIMGKLLSLTAWADSMSLKTAEEEAYETEHLNDAGTTKLFGSAKFPYMEKRAVGYTAFVETDDALVNDWQCPAPVVDEEGNITNWDAIQEVIVEKCKNNFSMTDDCGKTAELTDFKNTANVVNRFVAYHLLYGGMSVDEFVHHHNEYGYDYVDLKNPVQKNYSVNVWDYYATMGPNHGLLKIMQLGKQNPDYPYYLNRVPKYKDGIKDDYSEIGQKKDNVPGENGLNIQINPTNVYNGVTYDNNALNGFYYPIDHIMVYNDETRDALAGERMRIDVTTMLPEFMSNDLRGRKIAYFPNDYFSGITNVSSGTQIYYLQDGYVSSNGGWKDYQGDEFLITGRFDFVLKLPPVPKADTYEIRMGASLNTLRGMFQPYFGSHPDRTSPIGLPIDQRESVDMIPGSPWVADGSYSEATIRENDRNLRNQGYMKSPNYFCTDGTAGKTPTRNDNPTTPALRRILTTAYMEPGKNYYVRFKSAIDVENTQFMLDYFELVPTSIANGNTPEDIW